MEPGSRTLEAAGPSLPEEGVSLLFPAGASPGAGESVEGQPEYLPDLNLDQFVAAVTAGREEYELAPFFCTRLSDGAAVSYRQEVFLDLEDQSLFSGMAAFAQRMREVRAHLAESERLCYRHQAESWFVDAVGGYCDAVLELARDICEVDLRSRAVSTFRSYLARYAAGERFASLSGPTSRRPSSLISSGRRTRRCAAASSMRSWPA